MPSHTTSKAVRAVIAPNTQFYQLDFDIRLQEWGERRKG